MADTLREMLKMPRAPIEKRLDAVAWGLLFIWVGIAFLANVGWGVGLLGVGVITLGAEAARKYLGLAVERFWVVMGIVFVALAGFHLLDVQLREASIPGGAIPIAFIVVGLILVAFAFLPKR